MSINDIIQDKEGFLWFASENGLIRYDGYDFNIFLYKTGDSTSLSTNNVTCLAIDDSNGIWVGTSKGLNKFDKKTGGFRQYFKSSEDTTTLAGNKINDIFVDEGGRVWVASDGGLSWYFCQQLIDLAVNNLILCD